MTTERRAPVPRIAPLAAADRSPEATELLQGIAVGDGHTVNIFATVVRHPGLFRRWLPFGGKLLAGKLPARDRELLILRTAWRTGSEYEWGQHVPLAGAAGLTEEDIARLGADGTDGWTGSDAVLVAAADELHDTSTISDVTWHGLAATYSEQQLIELPMLVGHYHMVAFALNSLGVQLEAGVAGFSR